MDIVNPKSANVGKAGACLNRLRTTRNSLMHNKTACHATDSVMDETVAERPIKPTGVLW